MTYTVVYLDSRLRPRTTNKKEYYAESPEMALHIFVNESKHDNHFVAAIFEGPASKVFYTID